MLILDNMRLEPCNRCCNLPREACDGELEEVEVVAVEFTTGLEVSTVTVGLWVTVVRVTAGADELSFISKGDFRQAGTNLCRGAFESVGS